MAVQCRQAADLSGPSSRRSAVMMLEAAAAAARRAQREQRSSRGSPHWTTCGGECSQRYLAMPTLRPCKSRCVVLATGPPLPFPGSRQVALLVCACLQAWPLATIQGAAAQAGVAYPGSCAPHIGHAPSVGAPTELPSIVTSALRCAVLCHAVPQAATVAQKAGGLAWPLSPQRNQLLEHSIYWGYPHDRAVVLLHVEVGGWAERGVGWGFGAAVN